MTLQELLNDLKNDLEADIGEGQLNKADIDHIRDIFEEKMTTALGDLEDFAKEG